MHYGANDSYDRVKQDAHVLKKDLTDAANTSRQEVAAAAEDVAKMARQKVQKFSAQAKEHGQHVDTYAREHTWAAAALAAMAGVVVGVWLGRDRR